METESIIMDLDGRTVHLLDQHKVNTKYKTEKQQVFIIGSKGIPANYGGFETFVEKLTKYQVNDKIRYHVARLGNKEFRYEYNGAKCFNVEVPNIGPAKAIYYDVKALRYSIDYCKARPSITHPVFYILACRIGPFIGRFKREIEELGGVLYVNPDGHEWKRMKWGLLVRKYWKISEKYMVKHADILICDSKNIASYIQKDYKKYNPKTKFIAYGSDVKPSILDDHAEKYTEWLECKKLDQKMYYLVVGRFVPENNFEIMIREFMKCHSEKSLVIITTANEKFLKELEKKLQFRKDERIKFVGTVYNQELLKKIRENAYGYLHGHEVGGTNPSLLEALSSTNLNLLLDVGFNKEVGENGAVYWSKEEGNLANLIDNADAMSVDQTNILGERAKVRITSDYSWDRIVDLYESFFLLGREGKRK